MAASFDHLASNIDPLTIRHSFSDYFWPTTTHNNDQFLLQPQQLHHQYHQDHSLSPFSSSGLEQQQFQHNTVTTDPTPSASDPETSTTPNRRTTTTGLNSKPRITKRKSRATKKNQTTFITADPANFRQMVQQVTGIRFNNNSSTTSSSTPFSSSFTNLLRPDTHRPVGRLYPSSYLNDQQGQGLMGDRGVSSGLGVVGGGNAYGGGASDGFVSFPTLESWKVM